MLSVYSQENEKISCTFFNQQCTLTNLTLATKTPKYSDIDEMKNNVRLMQIFNGNFTEIPEKLFVNFKNVIDISIHKCAVTDITIESFESATYLQRLSISNNKIVTLNSNIFNGCENVISLSLENNLIENINFDVFQPMDKLGYLDLSGNRIKSVEQVVFPPNLYHLNVESNLIEEFDGKKLNVSMLRLESNSLTLLNVGKNCEVVHAANNKISEISVDEGNVLETAELQNNNLTDLRNISKCTKLYHLDVSKNNIQLKLETFSGLSKLMSLDISEINQTIDDLSFLKPMQSLSGLTVQQGTISNYSIENIIKIIPTLDYVSLKGNGYIKIVANPLKFGTY